MKKKDTIYPKPSKKHEALRHEFYQAVTDVLQSARRKSYRAVNFIMVEAYWNIGRMIVEEEQQGKKRAGYGEALMRNLSERLTLDFGKGFNVSNLWAFKQFHLAFPILRTLCGESSETHLSLQQSDLEQAIIGKLQAFMLELGKGFAFVARQQRISTDTKDFFIDLVFYNYLLKCFVLIDLKTGELTHQDIG